MYLITQFFQILLSFKDILREYELFIDGYLYDNCILIIFKRN